MLKRERAQMITGDKNDVLRNAWIYCRVGSNKHEAQRVELIRFANQCGFNIAEFSQDIGSGFD